MACLLDTQDVVCIWNDRYIKIMWVMPISTFTTFNKGLQLPHTCLPV